MEENKPVGEILEYMKKNKEDNLMELSELFTLDILEHKSGSYCILIFYNEQSEDIESIKAIIEFLKNTFRLAELRVSKNVAESYGIDYGNDTDYLNAFMLELAFDTHADAYLYLTKVAGPLISTSVQSFLEYSNGSEE